MKRVLITARGRVSTFNTFDTYFSFSTFTSLYCGRLDFYRILFGGLRLFIRRLCGGFDVVFNLFIRRTSKGSLFTLSTSKGSLSSSILYLSAIASAKTGHPNDSSQTR
jgi:hypothetical protein